MSLEVRDVSFRYGQHCVLSHVSFSAPSGTLLCVLGPNGVGKSTLFRCILGLLRDYTGSIQIDSLDSKDVKPELLARKIAYVPQSHAAVFPYTVHDMVLMGTTAALGPHALPGSEQNELATEALERLGISHLARRPFTQVSGGEAQLTLIARAIAQQAKILVMDEPTASLDYGNQIRVMEEIRKLVQSGYTVIQSTHNPEHAFLYADQVLVLLSGSAVEIGKPADILSEEMLFQIYGIHVSLYELSGGVRVCVPNRTGGDSFVGTV